jgi:hypothetical protein
MSFIMRETGNSAQRHANVAFGLDRPDLAPALRAELKKLGL